MRKFDDTEAKTVLVFNEHKRFISVFHSTLAAAKMLKTHTQSIHYACTGRCIATNGLYFRQLPDEIEVTLEDLGSLKLDEYDKLCGVNRKVYPTSKMTRHGMKYNKHKKEPK
jgi:hypothetical protein